ncbi:MAG: class I SAM-dependent methyltransferase [Candidatus Micrarchaeota archaeon]
MIQREKKKTGQTGARLPDPLVDQKQALVELTSIAEGRTKLSLGRFFELGLFFAAQKTKQGKEIEERESSILQIYEGFSEAERVRFFSMLYDRFADNYDQHMGEETGHFKAMKTVLEFAGPFIRRPLLDITCGTGELLLHTLRLMEIDGALRKRQIRRSMIGLPTGHDGIIIANEISGKMLDKAYSKLPDDWVAFTMLNALELPVNWQFKTIFCSQTMHIISEEDKTRLVRSMHRTLSPGGMAIVIEEDPFLISPSSSIEGIELFLRAVAKPISQDSLIGRFEANGFRNTGISATSPIDSKHVMGLHIFEKN